MSHITAQQLDAALMAELPVQELRDLLAHLDSGCESCAELLDDELDMDLLFRALEAMDGGSVEPEGAELERIWSGAAPSRGGWSWRPFVGLLVAALAMFAVYVAKPGVGSDQRPKGSDLIGVELAVFLGQEGPDGFDVQGRLQDGDPVSQGDTLLFQIDATGPAAVTVFAVQDGMCTLVWPTTDPSLGAPGQALLKQPDGGYAGWTVDPGGPLQLVAVASPTVADVDAMMRALEGGAVLAGSHSITLTVAR